MIELAEMVKKVVNPKAELVWLENTADDPSRRRPDITKVKSLLGWEPKVSVRGLSVWVWWCVWAEAVWSVCLQWGAV
jgi:UDP-glucuronate decarboxylase